MPFELRANQTTGEVTLAINTVDRIKFDVEGNVILLNSVARVIGGARLLPAGAFQLFQLPSAPAGWIAGDGSTIGAPGSGATRADNDTADLYAAWWSAYTDAQLPILTVTGAASSRGPSAAVDWAAGKRLTVFDVRGRFPRVAGTINGLTFANGTKYADTLQGHVHDNTMNISTITGGDYRGYSLGTLYSNEPASVRSALAAPSSHASYGTARVAVETAPVSIAMLGCYKL